MRDSLDRFQQSVFDRPVTELIKATGPKELSREVPTLQRRRLIALAKEYVRPGVHVGDLHDSLIKIQQQREIWNRFVETGHPPTLPGGLGDATSPTSRWNKTWLNSIGCSALRARAPAWPI
jgi:hypothetical protein